MEKTTKPEALGAFVFARASRLAERVLADDGGAKAALAHLRASVGRRLIDEPEVWGELLDGFPEELVGRGDLPNGYEEAAHAALSLFALHQQSRGASMNVSGRGFGAAIRVLADPTDAGELAGAVMRRFTTVLTADEYPEILHHLRGLVTQLRAADVGLDYGRLARDLLALRDPDRANGVRLRWSRDIYARPRRADADGAAPAPVAASPASTPAASGRPAASES